MNRSRTIQENRGLIAEVYRLRRDGRSASAIRRLVQARKDDVLAIVRAVDKLLAGGPETANPGVHDGHVSADPSPRFPTRFPTIAVGDPGFALHIVDRAYAAGHLTAAEQRELLALDALVDIARRRRTPPGGKAAT